MSKNVSSRVELIKSLLKEIHRGASLLELREKYKDELGKISPFEILMAEQQLVKEGVQIQEILGLCDLHVELFRESLLKRELRGLKKGHPIDLLMRENEWILKKAEILNLYAQVVLNATDEERARQALKVIEQTLLELKGIRIHYRKVQMLIFPYLERMGINAIPRVMWSREDGVLVKLRSLLLDIQRDERGASMDKMREHAMRAVEISREISELVFRENKILYPATYALLPEGAWAAIHEGAGKIGYLVEVVESQWTPGTEPIYPYEWTPLINGEQVEKLPDEFRRALNQPLNMDDYRIRREGDIELDTGFLSKEEIGAIFRNLPLELTYADVNDRVRFYTESELSRGFVRTKTILGRRLLYCHPPRLEKYVMMNVESLKQGNLKYREFWTAMGERILRVIVVPVKNRNGELLGVLEIVEDLTDVVKKPEEIKKKIMVL